MEFTIRAVGNGYVVKATTRWDNKERVYEDLVRVFIWMAEEFYAPETLKSTLKAYLEEVAT